MTAIFESNWDELTKGKTIAVDIWASWCGPCVAFSPIIDVVNKAEGGIKIYKCNIDENQTVGAKFGVQSIPTMIIFKDGKEIDRRVGGSDALGLSNYLEKFNAK